MRIGFLAAMVLGMWVGGCGKSTPDAAGPGGVPTTQERIKEDFQVVGKDLKEAATDVARDAKPMLNKAKEETRDVVHSAAEKVADWTTTQPGAAR